MRQNATRFQWSARREQAALLLAQDELTDVQIAEAVTVSRAQLARWKQHPVFQSRIQEHLAAWKAKVLQKGIAARERRIDALNHRHKLMLQVIAERAVSPDLQEVAGGKTGLIVKQVKPSGGNYFEEFAVDTGLLRELRAHEQQTAQELGQWAEKRELTGANGGPLAFQPDLSKLSDEELERLEHLMAKTAVADSGGESSTAS